MGATDSAVAEVVFPAGYGGAYALHPEGHRASVTDLRAEAIHWARQAVRRAFRHAHKPGQSPLACFSGAKPKDGKHRSRRRPTVLATATRPAGFSRPALVDGQALTGATHRAMAELEPLEFLWLQYRYRPQGLARTAHGESFLRAYFHRYQAEHLQGCKTGTRRMVRYLISVGMESESRPDRNIRPDGGDIDRRNWNKTYRPHWHRICLELSTLDGAALFNVAQKINVGFGVA